MWANRNLPARLIRAALVASLTAAIWPCAAQAQSASEWKLPDPAATASPRVQGPVDPLNPVLQSRSAPTAKPPAPSPSTVPTISPSAAPVRTPEKTASETRTPAPRPSPGDAPAPAATSTTQSQVLPPQPDLAAPSAPVAAAPSSSPSPQTDAVGAEGESWPAWIWAAAAAALVLAAAAFAFLRRRKTPPAEPNEAPAPPPKAAQPDPSPPARMPAPSPRPAATPVPSAEPTAPIPADENHRAPLASGIEGLHLTLAPRLLRISLVYATLQYQLEVENAGDVSTDPLTISGDMISAHASLGTRAQLAPDPARMAPLHALPALQPAQRMALKGELRLPLGAIVPVRQGEASYMAPLVRLILTGEQGVLARAVFHLGLEGTAPGQVSIRIDNTTGEYAPLAIREIEAARLPRPALEPAPLPLDPLRAAS